MKTQICAEVCLLLDQHRLGSKAMNHKHLQQLTNRLKHAMGMQLRLTPEESDQLLLLAEAIVDFGRVVHPYHGLSAPEVIVEIAELGSRFRETRQNIRNALLLLRDMGRAEPARRHGCWKLDLAGSSAREDLPAA